jgi:hypothetical protein
MWSSKQVSSSQGCPDRQAFKGSIIQAANSPSLERHSVSEQDTTYVKRYDVIKIEGKMKVRHAIEGISYRKANK